MVQIEQAAEEDFQDGLVYEAKEKGDKERGGVFDGLLLGVGKSDARNGG